MPFSKDTTTSSKSPCSSCRGAGGGGGAFCFWCWMQPGQSSLSSLPKRLSTAPQSLQNCMPSSPTEVMAGECCRSDSVYHVNTIKERTLRHFFQGKCFKSGAFSPASSCLSVRVAGIFSALQIGFLFFTRNQFVSRHLSPLWWKGIISLFCRHCFSEHRQGCCQITLKEEVGKRYASLGSGD